MLGAARGKELNKYVPDYVVYDLETTGISCQYDHVIEISAIKVQGGQVVEEFTSLVNPGRKIPWQASRVNHIYDDMVAEAPDFRQVLGDFLDFVGSNVLVGHNIGRFDMKFMYRDCEKYFAQTLANDYIDTLQLAKSCFPNWKHRKLENLADYYGISTEGAHRALNDCRMNQQVYELMAVDLSKGNISLQPQEPEKLCPACGHAMKKRQGRYGLFWGCSGYPYCRHTENI